MRELCCAVAVALLLVAMPAAAIELAEHLRANGTDPVTYVLSKVDAYPIVLLGENHWLAHDANLVTSIVPGLRECNVALAMEVLPAAAQPEIDELLAAPEWNGALATQIMRAAHWPYVEYREILRAVWKANRARPHMQPMTVIALGPPDDWRQKGIRYDEFMAQRVIDYVGHERRHVLAFVGMHHAFTRYLQVERRVRGRATEFMNRFGNILWRRYGEDVFLIAMHKPEWCGPVSDPTSISCPPFNGALDCAAASLGRPIAFDVARSPIATLRFPQTSFYAFAYPLLRFYDYADGYIWTDTIENTRGVSLIPLEEYAPDVAGDPVKVAEWEKQRAARLRPFERRGFEPVAQWRRSCASD